VCGQIHDRPPTPSAVLSQSHQLPARVTRRTAVGFSLSCALIAAALYGCDDVDLDVRADYDPAVDFSRFRTFKFVPMPASYKLGYPSWFTQHMGAAITAEMRKRGYEPVVSYPDLLINFSANLPKSRDGIATEPYYAYRYYAAWPAYAMGVDMDAIKYEHGTLNVDLIDCKRMQLVLEGVAVAQLQSIDAAKRDDAIELAVARILAQFPFRAGPPPPSPLTGS
jgi:hypothetical protein